jgi:hypothetical protein
MTTHDVKPCFCPVCFSLVEAATNASNKTNASPKPGDLSICWECGSPLMYDSLMMLYPPLESELNAYGARDPETFEFLVRLQQAVMERVHSKPRRKHKVKELIQ